MLRGLDALFGLSLGNETLITIAASLGSDVPFFLQGGDAVVSGFGERFCYLWHRRCPLVARGSRFTLVLDTCIVRTGGVLPERKSRRAPVDRHSHTKA